MKALNFFAICLLSLGFSSTCLGDDLNIGSIWFLGDSITQSNDDGDPLGSPRKSLFDKLTAANHDFSFTGHYTANVDGLPSTGNTPATNLYHYHSGISGSVIGANNIGRPNMTAGIPTWWNSGRLAVEKPKAVLIMLGTNDTDTNLDLANAPARMGNLIDDPGPTGIKCGYFRRSNHSQSWIRRRKRSRSCLQHRLNGTRG